MFIQKFHISAFGKIIKKEWNLCQGFNIFYGDNESGKSTIQWFIRGMFYGLKGGRRLKDGGLPPLKNYQPWSNQPYKGYLEYTLDNGTTYRIVRSFEDNKVKIQNMSTFEEITEEFESNRNVGVMFAKDHLGINETCFEQTVCIGQMECRLDPSGKKDLSEKLMNISQSGVEDISLIKAEDALKEALLTKVGTGKSTKRPRDIISQKLRLLYEKKELLDRKHESLLKTQGLLEETLLEENKLNTRFALVLKAEAIIKLRKRIIEQNKFLKSLKNIQTELDQIKKSQEELNKKFNHQEDLEEELLAYKNFTKTDRDWLLVTWHSIDKLEQDIKKVSDEVEKLIEIKKNQSAEFEGMELFRKMDQVQYAKLNELFAMNENERETKSNKAVEENKKDIERTEKNNRLITGLIITSSLLAIISIFTGISSYNHMYLTYIAPVFLGISAVLMLFLRGSLVKLKKLKKDNYMIDIASSMEMEKQREKDKLRKEIMQEAGVDNAADFLRLKSLFEEKCRQTEALDNKLVETRQELEDKKDTADKQKAEARNLLLKVGILDSSTPCITIEHIESFKSGMENWMNLQPDINYTRERLNEAQSSWKKQIELARELLDQPISDIKAISDKVIELESILDKIKNDIQEIKDNIMDMEETQKEYLFSALDDDYILVKSRIDTDMVTLKEEMENQKLKIKEYETQLEHNPLSDELQKTEEDISWLEEEAKELDELGTSLETAISVLQDSSRELQKDFVPKLNSKMGNILAKITDGKYTDIKADDKLMLNTSVPECEEIIALPMLSGGTVDQAYLALRMAATGIIREGGESLPFILDEVFSQYDESRTISTLKYLNEVAKDQQILFFTCKKRELELAKSTINPDRLNIIEL